jgi:hypothetical protein
MSVFLSVSLSRLSDSESLITVMIMRFVLAFFAAVAILPDFMFIYLQLPIGISPECIHEFSLGIIIIQC